MKLLLCFRPQSRGCLVVVLVGILESPHQRHQSVNSVFHDLPRTLLCIWAKDILPLACEEILYVGVITKRFPLPTAGRAITLCRSHGLRLPGQESSQLRAWPLHRAVVQEEPQ